MPTRKLLLLLTLVAVLGGSSIWYMETKLGLNVFTSESSVMPIHDMTDESADEDVGATESIPTTQTEPASTIPGSQSGTQATPKASVDSELAELNSFYDAGYDDSSLNSTFTSDGANTLTDSYDY